jgi:thiol-disulfide isomerase/thioredoxin
MVRLFSLVFCFYSLAATAADTGSAWPNIAARPLASNLESEQVPVVKSGTVTLVNLWATWCDACKVELKEMAEEFVYFKGNTKFQMAFVSLDKDPKKAEQWLDQQVPSLKSSGAMLYSDPEFKVAEALKADSFPVTVLIDRNGNMFHVERGFKEGAGSTKKLKNLAADLLKKAG